MNQPSDVAKYIIQVTAEPTTHGKALFVTGGNAVDIEEGMNRTESQWLGVKNARELNAGQVILGLVSYFLTCVVCTSVCDDETNGVTCVGHGLGT